MRKLSSGVAIAAFLLSFSAVADMQCGPFHLAGITKEGGWATVNDVKTTKQKVTFLKQKGDADNVKMRWIVAATKFQGNYAMNYLSQAGKATLDVEIVRSSRSQIKISGAYDCQPKE